MRARRTLATFLIVALFPLSALAFPFGGSIGQVIFCYNGAIFALIGPPIGGAYLWVPSTKTYAFGPPSHPGQWILGLTSLPYFCLVSISPVITVPGIAILMMGSSGPSAGARPQTTTGATTGSPLSGFDPATILNPGTGSGGTSGGTVTGSTGTVSGGNTAKVVISEVFYAIDGAHGAKPTNEWIEIYNAGTQSVDLSSWRLQDGSDSSDILPAGLTLRAGEYLVVTATSTTRALWSIPLDVQMVVLGSPIGNGLATSGDVLMLKNSAGSTVDMVSWGTNTAAFDPSITITPTGHSSARNVLSADTNSASDWVNRIVPTPGR